MVAVNINTKVRVRLTARGQQVLTERFTQEFPTFASHVPGADAEGWHTFCLWELMSLFGPALPPVPLTVGDRYVYFEHGQIHLDETGERS